MRILSIFKAAILLTVITGTACQTLDIEPTPGTVDAATARPSSTPGPTIQSSLTHTTIPSTTPTSTVTPSPTPTIIRKLPVNWYVFGDPRFGIEIPAPRLWLDATYLLRSSESGDRFGPLMLLLTDMEETAKRLMAGVPVDTGAYVFGYVGKSLPPAQDPAGALLQVVDELDLEDSTEGGAVSFFSNSIPAAYIDLTRDPLDLFPLLQQDLRYRLVLMIPEDGTPAVLLMATSPQGWDTHLATFTTLMDMVDLPHSRDRVLGNVESGEIVSGNLIGNIVDIWTFSGREGLFTTISLTPSDTRMDLTLTLIDPSGDVMFVIDDGYEGDSEALTDVILQETGTYIVEAREFFNENGRYELDLLLSDEAQFGGGGSLLLGQEITSLLVENGEHNWSFQGIAGQDITVILSSLDDQLDVILEVYGPDGSQLGAWDESFAGDAEVATGVPLPITGEYTILVRGFAGRGGRYQLSLDEGGESAENLYDAGDLAHGDLQREYLREDEVHAWFIEGRENDALSIQVSPLGDNMDLEISLVGPAVKEYLVSVDEHLAGELETIQFSVPVDGQFIIVVREFFGNPGEYDIALDIISGAEIDLAGNIVSGETVEAALASGRSDGWLFEGSAGDAITVTLTPLTTERDLLIELLRPSGASAELVDAALTGLPEQLDNYELDEDGQWMIVIREFFGEAAEYRLELTAIDQ
jgi:hypothetical protein